MADRNKAASQPPADTAKTESLQPEAELKNVQAELERRVAELSQTNHRLQGEVAERQRRQIQQLALHRVREEVWKMQDADDIEKVIVVLAENLRAAQLTFDNCSIHAINDLRGTATITDFHQTNTVRTSTKKRDLPSVVRMWQCAEPTYRRDLDTEDPYGERDRLRTKWACPVRSVIDVPFSRGTLALNSTRAEAFSAADIVFLQELTAVLSEGFRRLEDLEQLAASEQRYRTLVETPSGYRLRAGFQRLRGGSIPSIFC